MVTSKFWILAAIWFGVMSAILLACDNPAWSGVLACGFGAAILSELERDK